MSKKAALPVLLVVILVAFVAPSQLQLFNIGYISGHQGLEFQFDSIYWKGYWYDSSHRGPNPNYDGETASSCDFFDRVNFDPDDSSLRKPNLMASQGAFVVDTSVEPKTWEWQVKVSETSTTETYKVFRLYRFRCEWSMSLWLEGADGEAQPVEDTHYYDLQLWIKVVPKAFLYFTDNPDRVYFAPALFQLQSIKWYGVTEDNTKIEDDYEVAQLQDIFPGALGETLGIFYSRGGAQVDIENVLLSYQGMQLDPQIFRDEYWIRIGVDRFMPLSWWEWGGLGGWSYRFPSALLKFQVYVFVVGEWTVTLQKGEEIPQEPHEPPQPVQPWWEKVWQGIVDWWNNLSPWTWFGIGVFFWLLIIAMVVIALLWFFGLPAFLRKKK